MIKKILKYDLLHAPVKRNSIYYVTDLHLLYKDFGNSRQERKLYPAVVINTERERLNKIRPTNGVNYYVVESNSLWCYDTRWVLKDGNPKKFNSYIYDNNGVSPVVIDDSSIVSAQTGDRIIDNNGLLGNGSVCVRDENRVIKSVLQVDQFNSEIAVKGYMTNGITFYPYSVAASAADRTRIGSLQLGVKLNDAETSSEQDVEMSGCANYHGDFNVFGDIKIVTNTDDSGLTIFDSPLSNQNIYYTFHSFGYDPDDSDTIVLYTFRLEIIDDDSARLYVVSSTNGNSDLPNSENVLDYEYGKTILYECQRVFDKDNDVVTYTLNSSVTTPGVVTLHGPEDGLYTKDSIAVEFSNTCFHKEGTPPCLATLYAENYVSVSDLVGHVESLESQSATLLYQLQSLEARVAELERKLS